MSSTQLTNSDLSEPEEVLDTEEGKPKESNESNEISTLNSQDQEVQSEEKQKDKVLGSETIVEEQKQLEEEKVVEGQQKNVDNQNVSDKKESNQEERHEENLTAKNLTTNETEQISEENKDQSTLSEWSAVWDDNVQGYYYWNTVTNETTWENPHIQTQNINHEYSQHDYYYSQYGYYPDAYYYGYDHSALTAPSDMTTTTVVTTEPPTNPLDSILDRIDKEIKTKLDENSSKKKKSSTFDSQFNDQQDQNEHHEKKDEKDEKDEQTSSISSSTDLDSYYDQSQTTTNDQDYQSFLAEHGGNDGGDYKVTARFNARTGKFQRDPTLNPEKFSADSKAIRQMSYFFDYDQFAESRGSASSKRLSSDASLGDSIRSPKKLNKKDIEMFKQKKKEKKDMKKKSWLLSDD